jgi:hypothetical protein
LTFSRLNSILKRQNRTEFKRRKTIPKKKSLQQLNCRRENKETLSYHRFSCFRIMNVNLIKKRKYFFRVDFEKHEMKAFMMKCVDCLIKRNKKLSLCCFVCQKKAFIMKRMSIWSGGRTENAILLVDMVTAKRIFSTFRCEMFKKQNFWYSSISTNPFYKGFFFSA